ncbi:MAG: hypothetical protein RLZZ299_990, partial [Pseudomonadota bacterium]
MRVVMTLASLALAGCADSMFVPTDLEEAGAP